MTIKIDNKIVGYSVKKESDPDDGTSSRPVLEVVSDRELMHEEIKRPQELRGHTYKVRTPLSDHAIYITINNIVLNIDTRHEQEYPFEIFINTKNMEHYQWVLALTLVISAVFRKGGDSTFLIDELKDVFDPQGGYFKKGGRFMPSLVAEIGEVLETHMKKIGLIEDEELSKEHQALIAEKAAAMAAITPGRSGSTTLNNTASGDTASGYKVSDDTLSDNSANTPGAVNAASGDGDMIEDSNFPPGSQLCRKCLVQATVLLDGCMTCLNCGESKCS